MFGPRLGTVFASRWRALWFAGSMLLLAYCSVPAPEETATGEAGVGLAIHPGEGQEQTTQAHPANPWALDKHG